MRHNALEELDVALLDVGGRRLQTGGALKF